MTKWSSFSFNSKFNMFLRAIRASIISCDINPDDSFVSATDVTEEKNIFFALYIYILYYYYYYYYKIFVLLLFLYSMRVKCCFYSKKLVFDLLLPIDLRALNAGPLVTKQRNDFNFVTMGSIKTTHSLSAGIIVTFLTER